MQRKRFARLDTVDEREDEDDGPPQASEDEMETGRKYWSGLVRLRRKQREGEAEPAEGAKQHQPLYYESGGGLPESIPRAAAHSWTDRLFANAPPR